MNTFMIYVCKFVIGLMSFFVCITDSLADLGEDINIFGESDNPFLYALNAFVGLSLIATLIIVIGFAVYLSCVILWFSIITFPKTILTIIFILAFFSLCGYLSKIK